MIANLMGGDGLIVLVIALVVLVGGSQLPKIARNVGAAGREFRKAQQEAEDEAAREKSAKEAVPAPQALPAPPVTGATSHPAGGPAGPEGTITLTPAQLDALLKARNESTPGSTARTDN